MRDGVLTAQMLRLQERMPAPISANHNIIASPSREASALIDAAVQLTKLEVNWDGQGGLPVTYSALSASLDVLIGAVQFGIATHVMPVGDGGLLVEWKRNERLLQIEWSADGTADCALLERNEILWDGPLPADRSSLFRNVAFGPSLV